jgi:hypothetical protein
MLAVSMNVLINRLSPAAFLSIFVIAGCSGGGAPAGAPASSQPPQAASSAAAQPGGQGSSPVSCAIMPASLVNSALGTDLADPAQNAAGGATVCQYQGTKAGSVIIRVQRDDTAASFAIERATFDKSGQPTKDLAGFGDQAYTNTKHMPLNLPDVDTLVARKGPVEILITSSAGIAAEQGLAQQLFAKIG